MATDVCDESMKPQTVTSIVVWQIWQWIGNTLPTFATRAKVLISTSVFQSTILFCFVCSSLYQENFDSASFECALELKNNFLKKV